VLKGFADPWVWSAQMLEIVSTNGVPDVDGRYTGSVIRVLNTSSNEILLSIAHECRDELVR
jgi:hypothetical protein